MVLSHNVGVFSPHSFNENHTGIWDTMSVHQHNVLIHRAWKREYAYVIVLPSVDGPPSTVMGMSFTSVVEVPLK